MPLTDRPPDCTCLGSGYATPTGHHPGCPRHIRQVRQARLRAEDALRKVGEAFDPAWQRGDLSPEKIAAAVAGYRTREEMAHYYRIDDAHGE